MPLALRSLTRTIPRRVLPTSFADTSPLRRSLFTVVQQGSEAWRLSLGRAPTRLAPGIHLMLPIYHSIRHVDLRETSVDIMDLSGFTSDNVPVTVSGSLFFRVKDGYHACFSVDNFQNNVKNIGTSAMRSVVGYFAYDEVIGDRNKINTRLHEVIGTSIAEWGVACTRFEIQNFKPSNRDVEKQLELQMQAERERRKQILDTQALVNVAEGQKQRAILESEGALQSQLNSAAGERQKRILESEGARQAALNEGRALAEQVEIIAKSLAGFDGTSAPEDRKKALETLLEIRKIEQLNAIALGHGNTTYFFGEASPKGSAYAVDNAETRKLFLAAKQGVDIGTRPVA